MRGEKGLVRRRAFGRLSGIGKQETISQCQMLFFPTER